MRFSSAIGIEADPTAAARAALARVRDELGASVDLVLAFGSGHSADAFEQQLARVRRELPGALALGCSASGTIGAGRELEGTHGLALLAARLPGVRCTPFAFEAGASPSPQELRRALAAADEPPAGILLLADPFSLDAEAWLERVNALLPGRAAVGGLASGGMQPGDHVLCAGERAQRAGLVGVALHGALALDTIVAQGCRPIGVPLFVTRARNNLVLELDGRSPLALLQELFENAAPEDRPLFRGSLFAGLEMREGRTQYGQGDFLVRNIAGVDPQSGAIAIAAPVRESQILQFQLRDRRASAQDLERRLEAYRRAHDASALRGALLCSCVGRGAALYGQPDHDSRAFKRALGDVPLGGFFGNGELGPVEGRLYLHGYTSAIGLFRTLD
jgi:small ligand-binding sensory domain FIST